MPEHEPPPGLPPTTAFQVQPVWPEDGAPAVEIHVSDQHGGVMWLEHAPPLDAIKLATRLLECALAVLHR